MPDPESRRAGVSINQETQLLGEWIQRTRGSVAPFHVTSCTAIHGPVDAAALERAIDNVISRHSILRAAFPDFNDPLAAREIVRRMRRPRANSETIFWQTIHPRAPFRLKVVEAGHTGLPGILEACAAEAAAPFDYSRPPLLRAVLYRAGPSASVLLLVVHHLLVDYWSMLLLESEIAAAYDRPRSPGSAEASPVQFDEFVAAERHAIESHSWDDGVDHWRRVWSQTASSRIAMGDLPFARPPAAGRPASGFANAAILLEAPLAASLRALCRSSRVSVHTAGVAATALSLASATGRLRLSLLGYLSNRVRLATTRALGWYSNACPIPVELPPEGSALRLFESIRDFMLGAVAHQAIPLGYICRILAQEGRLPTALDGGWISFDYFAPSLQRPFPLGGVAVERLELPRESPNFCLSLLDSPGGLWLRCAYPDHRLDPQGVARFLECWKFMVESVVRNPDRDIAALVEAGRARYFPETSTVPPPGVLQHCVHPDAPFRAPAA